MRKEASCLGTNYVGTNSELYQCVHDAEDMSSLFGFLGFYTTTIFEKQVTKVKFLSELNRLVDLSISGEVSGIANTHSGHGTNNLGHEGLYFLDGVVWDYEIVEILSKIPKGFPFFIFWDVCFSGGMLKKAGAKVRYFPTTEIPKYSQLKGMKESVSLNAIYISACSDDEYSYDASDLNNGAGTYYLKNTFTPNVTFQEWFNLIRVYLPSEDYPQTPQLICKDELKLKKAFSWFDGEIEALPDEEIPVISLTFWQKIWSWFKKLFGIK